MKEDVRETKNNKKAIIAFVSIIVIVLLIIILGIILILGNNESKQNKKSTTTTTTTTTTNKLLEFKKEVVKTVYHPIKLNGENKKIKIEYYYFDVEENDYGETDYVDVVASLDGKELEFASYLYPSYEEEFDIDKVINDEFNYLNFNEIFNVIKDTDNGEEYLVVVTPTSWDFDASITIYNKDMKAIDRISDIICFTVYDKDSKLYDSNIFVDSEKIYTIEDYDDTDEGTNTVENIYTISSGRIIKSFGNKVSGTGCGRD